jgi:hypothetical protein
MRLTPFQHDVLAELWRARSAVYAAEAELNRQIHTCSDAGVPARQIAMAAGVSTPTILRHEENGATA